LNQQVKDLIQKLGEAIHESVAESDAIAGVVREIREQGFDVLLMLEATIGLNESDDEAETAEGEEGNEAAHGPFTRNDLTFLSTRPEVIPKLPVPTLLPKIRRRENPVRLIRAAPDQKSTSKFTGPMLDSGFSTPVVCVSRWCTFARGS